MMTYLWIALGSAIGGVGRFWLAGLLARSIGEVFPWGTFVVNVTGSFAIGFIGFLTGPDGRLLVAPDARLFMMVGICGGYTTFSSFSLQTLILARDGDFLRAGLNVVASVIACLVAVWLGSVAAMLIDNR